MIKLSDGRRRIHVPVTVAAKSHFMELERSDGSDWHKYDTHGPDYTLIIN